MESDSPLRVPGGGKHFLISEWPCWTVHGCSSHRCKRILFPFGLGCIERDVSRAGYPQMRLCHEGGILRMIVGSLPQMVQDL